jgi:hypothetical protein
MAEWHTGILGCAEPSDCLFCMMATPCGCVAYGMNEARLKGHTNCIDWGDCTHYTCYCCYFFGSTCSDECSSTDNTSYIKNGFNLIVSPAVCLFAPLTKAQVDKVGRGRGRTIDQICCETRFLSMFCWPCMLTRVHRELIQYPDTKAVTLETKTKNSMFDNIKLV